MLIIPVERKINWRRPPWVTLALILLNFLTFFYCRQYDARLMEQAASVYQQEDLLTLEVPVFEDYLHYRQTSLHDASAEKLLQAVEQLREAGKLDLLTGRLLSDTDFYHYALDHGDDYWSEAVFRHWQQERAQLQQDYVEQASSKRQGLTPGDLHAWNLISYQFLHGGWAHIIGNMLFLFLIGFTVEQALGGLRYLFAYLLSGVLAGLVHVAFEWGSLVPLVGASGAISGLMGMYLAIFGRKQIRFFYFVGFYMGYLRATALLMLPVWLGKQLYDYWASSETHVAYMAHVGGLVAGALLVWLLGRSWLQVREEFKAPQEDEAELRFRQAYATALKAVSRMDFAQAQLQLGALWKRHPERLELLEQLYQLAKLRPDLPAYAERTHELLAAYLRKGASRALVRIWRDYMALANAQQPLPAELHKQVFFAALKATDLQAAEMVFGHLQQADNPLFHEEACRLLMEACQRLNLPAKVRRYRQLMDGTMVDAVPAERAPADALPDMDTPIPFN